MQKIERKCIKKRVNYLEKQYFLVFFSCSKSQIIKTQLREFGERERNRMQRKPKEIHYFQKEKNFKRQVKRNKENYLFTF